MLVKAASVWASSKVFAPLHLLHQKSSRHAGVVFGLQRRTMQLTQIGGAAQWVFQALVGLVDPHRPLHGQALVSGSLQGELVGVHLLLQGFPLGVKLRCGSSQIAWATRTIQSRWPPKTAAASTNQRFASDSERLAAAATITLVGIVEFEAFVQAFTHEVELGAVQISQALGIDQDLQAMGFKHHVFCGQGRRRIQACKPSPSNPWS